MKTDTGALLFLSLTFCSCGSTEALSTPPVSKRPVAAASESASASVPSSDDSAPEASSAPPAPAPPEKPPLPEVVFEPIEPAPAPAKLPSVTLSSPRKNALIPAAKAADFDVKLDVKGWDLSVDGNHIQVILDNRPYVRVTDVKRSLKLKDLAPVAELTPGQHFLAAIPTRGNGQTVKPVGNKVPIAVVPFFVEKKAPVVWKEGTPLLIYSSPQTGPAPEGGVLVDFYVLNAPIAQGRFVVHAAVSGPGLRVAESLSEWKPWRVRNARPGLHLIQIALFQFVADEMQSSSAVSVTYVSKPVPGNWSSTTREFTIDQ